MLFDFYSFARTACASPAVSKLGRLAIFVLELDFRFVRELVL